MGDAEKLMQVLRDQDLECAQDKKVLHDRIAILAGKVRLYKLLRDSHKNHRRKLLAENKRLGAALYDMEQFGLVKGNEMIADIEFDDSLGVARVVSTGKRSA
jgi:hypothetical protein